MAKAVSDLPQRGQPKATIPRQKLSAKGQPNSKSKRATTQAVVDPASHEPPEAPRNAQRSRKGYGDDLGAAELTRRVAESLRRFRAERRISLDELAERSGVSRAALSQIEGRRTNPTLSVLWKVAVGLGVPFHDSGTSPAAPFAVQRAGDAPPLRSADGRTESRLLSPSGSITDTEVYELRFLPRAVHQSDAHAAGARETLVVMLGTLQVSVAGTSVELRAGDSVAFHADVPHIYENAGAREVRCINVIQYVRG